MKKKIIKKVAKKPVRKSVPKKVTKKVVKNQKKPTTKNVTKQTKVVKPSSLKQIKSDIKLSRGESFAEKVFLKILEKVAGPDSDND